MANPAYGRCYPYEAPAVGEDDQRAFANEWRHIGAAWGDGIVNATNPGGSSDFSLAPSTSDRTVVLNLGEIRVRGIHFEPTQGSLTLTIPAVAAGSTRADRLLARLDPAAKQITFYIKSGTAVTSGSPVAPGVTRVTGGVWELVLWRIEGGNVAANALTYTDNRVWLAQTVHVNSAPGVNPNLNLGLTDGSRAFHLPTREEWVQTYPAGVATWTNIDRPVWRDITLAGSGALSTQGAVPPQYSKVRGWVELQGGIRRTNSNPLATAGQDAVLGTLPDGFRPGASKNWWVATSVAGTASGGRVNIGADGVIHFVPPADTTWASLDGVRFYAEN
jgi:hypothetical protein